MSNKNTYRTLIKPLFDRFGAAVALLVLSPLLVALACIVRFAFGAPVLFRQLRPGHHGRPFTILKFRTMSDARDGKGELLPDEERITRMGRLLRAHSLDELPELFNVLKGEMSLVGPRPLMMEYLGRYSPEQARRHDVMPGVTGWAQICGRNALSWEEKFRLDVWYVDHQSLALDFRILLKTVWAVLSKNGISEEGYVSASEFMGSSEPARAHENTQKGA